MKVSTSIEIIWQMAGREAIAADFGEIEPEHFMIALLQFADKPLSEVEKLGPGAEAVKVLKSDIRALKAKFAEKKIDSGVVRSELRKAMGKGENPYEGKQLHRTPAAREVFDKAARQASESGSDTLMAMHILSTLMETPSPALAQVLSGNSGPKIKGEGKQPLGLLYEYGKDLKSLVMQRKSSHEDKHIAEARAVLRVLDSSIPNSVFLVTDDLKTAKEVILAVTRLIYSKDAPASLKGKRLLDLSEIKPNVDSSQSGNNLFEKLLTEAGSTPGFILYLPVIFPSAEKPVYWADMLRTLTVAGKVQFAAPISENVAEQVKRDPVWRRVVHLITIATSKADAIPFEL